MFFSLNNISINSFIQMNFTLQITLGLYDITLDSGYGKVRTQSSLETNFGMAMGCDL